MNCLSTWYVRGMNWIVKKGEVVDGFRNEKFELLALNNMKIKRNGEILWHRISGIYVGLWRMKGLGRAR